MLRCNIGFFSMVPDEKPCFTNDSANFHAPLIQPSCKRPAISITWASLSGESHFPLLQEIVMSYLIKTRSDSAKFVVAAAAIAFGFTAMSGTALAQQPSASLAYPVSYSDLDVSKMKDTKTLYLRVRYGAEMVCQSAASWGQKEGEACVRKAVDEAVARANIPLLSQYHQLRSKGDKAGLVQLANAN
jgi:UrcA family protein